MATTRHARKPRKVKAPQQSSTAPSRRSVSTAFGLALVVAAALVLVAVFLRKNDAPTPVATPVVNIDRIPQSSRVLGDPKAKITLIEFADPQCPGCRYYTLSIYPKLVDEYVRTGKVKTQYHGYPFIGPDSIKGLRFILAAGFQNKLWQLMEALYRNQGAENSGWLTDALVRRLAGEIPGLDVDRLFTDAKSPEVTRMIEADLKQVQAHRLPGTPSFLVQVGQAKPYVLSVPLDVGAFRSALDDALRG
jgi:protein-disulfide isomerase